MRKISLNYSKVANFNSVLTIFGLFVIMTFVVGCDKQESNETNETKSNNYKNYGKYTKEITIYDEKKENSAIIMIGSDDEALINSCNTENFTIVPIKTGEKIDDVTNNYSSKFSTEKDYNQTNDSDEIAVNVSIKFISKNFSEDVSSFFLHTDYPVNPEVKSGWILETMYSDEYGHPGQNTNNRVNCYVLGQNFWHRGYCKVEYLPTWGGSSWDWLTTPDNTYVEYKDGEDDNFYRSPCYMMIAYRKYKGNPNSVICIFTY